MSQLIPFQPGAQLPAAIADAFGDNIPEKQSLPSLSYRGKSWRIVLNGNETLLTRKDPDTGESVPASTVNIVVLAFNPKRSRAYYPGAYEEGKNVAPACSSINGETPDVPAEAPIVEATGAPARTCAECPMSAKGSKISDNGKQSTACTTYKQLAVVPSAKLDMEPLRLRLAQTSMWDKDNNDQNAQGWFAWDQYVDYLRTNGVKHTAAVATHVKFDPVPAHPKLLFKVAGWLPEAAIPQVKAAMEHPSIPKLINSVRETTEPEEGAPSSTPAAAPAAPSAPASAPATAADKRPRGRPPGTTKAAAAPAQPAAPAPAPAAPTVSMEDELGDGFGGVTEAAPAPAKPAAPAAKPAAPAAAGDDLSGLLDAWDD
jgi:hypothetical protein